MNESKTKNGFEFYFLIIATIIILPLLYFKFNVDPVITFRLFFLTIILLFTNLILLFRIKKYYHKLSCLSNPIFIIYFGYVIFTLLSLLKTINITTGYLDAVKIFTRFILLVFAVLLLSYKRKNVFILCKTIIIGAFIFCCIGLLQHFFNLFYFIPGIDVVYSTFINRNLFSSAIFLTLPFSIYAYLQLSKGWRIISYILICISIYLIIIIKARAVWLALILSLSISLLLIFFLKKQKSLKKLLCSKKIIILALSLVIIIFSGFFLKKSDTKTRLSKKNVTSTNTLEIRLKAWQKTLPMIKDNWLLGVGIGNWKINLPKYGVAGMKTEKGAYQYIRPHNDFIWVLAEIGVIGFIFYLSIFITTFYFLFRIIKYAKNKNDKIYAFLLLFNLIGYLVIASFSFPKERIFHSILIIFIISLAAILYNFNFPFKKILKKPFFLSLLMLILPILAVLIWYNYNRMKSETHLFFGLRAKKRIDYQTEIAALSKIDTRLYNLSPYAIPVLWYRGVAYYDMENIDKALLDFEAAYKNHPYHIYILNNLASCYEEKNQHKQAITFYKKVLGISPYFEESLINLSAVYYNIGKYQKAYKTIEKCKTKNLKYLKYRKKIIEKLESN